MEILLLNSLYTLLFSALSSPVRRGGRDSISGTRSPSRGKATNGGMDGEQRQTSPEYQLRIYLNKYGTLVLISGGEGKVWESATAFRRDGKTLELLETGNMVLTNGTGGFVWQSFASPTDTLLPGQQLTRNTVLVSNRDAGNYLPGSYSFKFNDDNVLYLIYSGPEVSSTYFPLQDSAVYAQGRSNFNSSRLAAIDDMGAFSSSDLFHFSSSDYGRGPRRRLTLDHDGLLRVYSMKEPNWAWEVVCYGICIYAPEPTCTCPPGFSRKDPSDWSKGCVPPFNLTFDQANVDFLKFPRTDYYGYDLDTFSKDVSLENCTERPAGKITDAKASDSKTVCVIPSSFSSTAEGCRMNQTPST
ncbi:unnamed protein product [Spirodela intermedia]|uniref:Bulb-type lectin domain-containing protein n=1 Tax=Spirodela intermedia TaxID=51605 RepID=A0ABN7ED59_SPIIN|nr:unnamed protein product [Spirodela intermedia]